MFHVKHQALLEAFPSAGPNLESYANWLATEGVVRGLIGPREVDRIWDRHLANCAALAELITTGASVIDIGSGAGLPGLVVAIIRPDCQVTLVEPLLRRSEFLQEVATDLSLENVTVIRARAEQVKDRKASVVTARAVAPLERLLGWAMPLVAPGGELLAMKGSNAAQEIVDAHGKLSKYQVEICQVGQAIVDPPTTIVRVTR
jgi:16S rRNA (guanine527-N7)-methyltransferase